ncbi:MAG: iron-containing alcohol dehydrogenase [Thermosipho sp. (in: Bacteria)]|nr:iron-containing alcohol dehydrogenase [Thermosipho sp. (in: thermotogales)]
MGMYLPTKIFFEDNYKESEKLIDSLGNSFLIITGKSSKINGSLEDLLVILNKLGKKYEIYDECLENPPKELIEKIIKKFGKNWDVVVGLGGGSPMDTAKAVAVLCKNDIEVEDLYEPSKYSLASKIICIPTTSGTGSEVTQYSVLTVNGLKKGFKHEAIFPTLSILEPKYTLTLSKELTISTGLDALSHAIESALSLRANDFSDLFAFKAIEIIKNTLPKLVDDLNNYELRKNMLYASTLAGIAISITGTTIAHALGYSLTTEKNIKHGVATAIFLPFEIENATTEKSQKISNIIGNMLDFLKNLDVKVSFEINDNEINRWAETVSKASHIKVTPGNYNIDKIKEAYNWLINKSELFGR